MVIHSENRNARSSQEFLPFEMGYLTEKFIRKAEDELKETPESREQNFRELRKLILSDPEVAECRSGDEYLLQFLRARKFNLQRAFALYKRMQAFKRKHKNYFNNMTWDGLERLVTSKTLSFLPYRDKDGCAIVVIKFGLWNPSEVGIDDFVRCVILLLWFSIEDPATQVNGYKVIWDFKGNPLKYLRYCTPYYAFLLYHGTQECFPGRFKGIHAVNPNFFFKVGWSIIHPFLSEKLKKRIFLHGNNIRALKNYFPEELLPVEFQGQLKDYDFSAWIKKALAPEFMNTLSQCS